MGRIITGNLNDDDNSEAPIDEKNKKSRKRKRKGTKPPNTTVPTEQDHVSKKTQEKVDVNSEPASKVSRQTVLEQRIRPPTLLEKLLLREIRQERNKILQCVRY